MKHWDLSTGTGRLELALQSLGTARNDVAEMWDDDASRYAGRYRYRHSYQQRHAGHHNLRLV